MIQNPDGGGRSPYLQLDGSDSLLLDSNEFGGGIYDSSYGYDSGGGGLESMFDTPGLNLDPNGFGGGFYDGTYQDGSGGWSDGGASNLGTDFYGGNGSDPFASSIYDSSYYSPTTDFGGTDTTVNFNPVSTEQMVGDGGGRGNEFLRRYRDAVKPFQPLLRNPIISTLMSLHPATALLKTAMSGPNSVGGFLGSLFGSKAGPIGSMLGGLGGAQAANYATEGKFMDMSARDTGGVVGGLMGSMSGNPYGGMLGSLAGRELGGASTPSGGGFGFGSSTDINTGGFGDTNSLMANMDTTRGWGQNMLPTGMNNGMGGVLANVGMSSDNNRAIGGQIKTLEGLFGQDSSYAKAMRQQLERRDAAGGRRSQYGPREVELQAMLAGNAAKLQPGLQQLYTQKMNNRNLLVQSLLRNPNLTQGLKDGWAGLSGMFGGGGASAPAYEDPFQGGGFQSGNEGMGS